MCFFIDSIFLKSHIVKRKHIGNNSMFLIDNCAHNLLAYNLKRLLFLFLLCDINIKLLFFTFIKILDCLIPFKINSNKNIFPVLSSY